MKKIGILTFHYADNYGAVLQAWALREILNRLPDCDAQFINYVPKGYCIYPYEATEDGIQKMTEKRKKYERFLRDNCDIKSPIIQNAAQGKYEFYCVGSDQVWNLELRENQDLEYFLPNLGEDSICFSYAASVGKNSLYEQKDIFQKYLPKFKAISLREKWCLDSIQEIYQKKIVQVLDPTLLLEEKDYEPLVCPEEIIKDDYIFFFVYPMGDEVRKYVAFVNTLARKYHLKVVHTCTNAPQYMFDNNAGCVMYDGIEEFLWYVKYSKIVVTNSYHGLIFSILFQKPFYLIVREKGKERIMELVELLKLQDRVVRDYIPVERLSNSINYEYTNKILEVNRRKSILFLEKVLGIEKYE